MVDARGSRNTTKCMSSYVTVLFVYFILCFESLCTIFVVFMDNSVLQTVVLITTVIGM